MEGYHSFIEYFCDTKYSAYLNLITTILGAFLGLGAALWMYYFQVKREKKKEKSLEKENDKDLLKYYSELIQKVLTVTEKNLELLDVYIEEQEKELTLLQILPRVPSNDFDRLKSIDSRGVFEAWTSLFNDKDRIKQYRKTNSALDLIEGMTNLVYSMQEHKNNISHNELLVVKSIVDDIPDRLSSIAFEMSKKLGESRHKDPSYIVIDKYLKRYRELVDSESSLDVFTAELVTPLLEEVFNDFKDADYCDEITMLCKKGRVKLNDMKVAVQYSLDDFKTVRSKMAESIEILNTTNNKITAILSVS